MTIKMIANMDLVSENMIYLLINALTTMHCFSNKAHPEQDIIFTNKGLFFASIFLCWQLEKILDTKYSAASNFGIDIFVCLNVRK